MKQIFLSLLFLKGSLLAQELYPYTEPASNMPSHSLSIKHATMLMKGVHTGNKILQRHSPELMLGLNRNWMVHGGATFSNMHQPDFRFESVRLYAKYRFFSRDEVHRHFRMAFFGAGSYSRNHLDHNELNTLGEQSGAQGGLIATQLLNRTAVSGSVSYLEVLDGDRWNKVIPQVHAFRSLNYSFSAGYLLFPIEYKSYDQTNVNLYAELLGSRNLDYAAERYFLDLAPSIQFIFKSVGKLNVGYRFQLAGDIYRLSQRSFMISYEHIFLNALRGSRNR